MKAIKKIFTDLKNRKKIHYSLLISIFLLQFFIVVLWYNETYKNNKIENNLLTINKLDKFSSNTFQIDELVLESQDYFNKYISTKDNLYLNKYLESLKKISYHLDNFQKNSETEKEIVELFYKKNKAEDEILSLKSSIDSVVNNFLQSKNADEIKKINADINSEKFLVDFNTKTYVKVDSVPKKGLFTRLGQAITGKMDVQREHKDVIVTLKYMNKVNKGTIEEQIQYIIDQTKNYYKNEYEKLKNSLENLNGKNAQLAVLNKKLLLLSNKTIPSINSKLNLQKNKNLNDLNKTISGQKTIRNISIVLITLLMMFISIILFGITKLEFEYENQLQDANQKITQNLNFKNRIISMLSHEIRSPLSMVSFYSKNIANQIDNPEIKQTMKSVEFTTNSLLMLSGQIIEYSKANNQKPQLTNKTFNLNQEIQNIVNVVQLLTENNGNEFSFENKLEKNTVVVSDLAKIHQLFYNLVGNANKFTQNGKIKISAKNKTLSDFETQLTVTVFDNGIGISKNNLEKIFDPHYQIGTIAENHPFSMGIGLSICKDIVELFDGSISIDSAPKNGTTITFNINLAKA